MDENSAQADIILVLRCQLRDEVAFQRLMMAYSAKLSYYVRRLIAPKHEVEDVLQKIWMTTWSQLPKLRSPASFRPWLYRIARNQALQTLRGYIPEVPLDKELVTEPAEEHFGAEEAAAVHVALEKLPFHHREALTLRFIEDLSYEEIAEVVGCSVGTVRSRIYYAKKSLRRIMEGLDND